MAMSVFAYDTRDLHLLASAREVDGMGTLVLWNDGIHLAAASRSANPGRRDVEGLLSNLVESSAFRQLANSAARAGANSTRVPEVSFDQVLSQCAHWSKTTRSQGAK